MEQEKKKKMEGRKEERKRLTPKSYLPARLKDKDLNKKYDK